MWQIIWDQWSGGFGWLVQQVLCQTVWTANYFWMVTLLTGSILSLEWLFPWRQNQPFFRKDWGLDLLYLYANMFIFAIVLEGVYALFDGALEGWSLHPFQSLEWGWQLLLFFVIQDFLQWGMHRLLHRVDWLWQFHQIHHSVEEMGVASHFRYHWMENVLYKPTKLAVLALFAGVEPQMAVLVHMGSLLIGHLNHANLSLDWGPLRYILNSPKMHLLHHSRERIADGGVNFAISLTCWDFLFGTAHQPLEDAEMSLGFAEMDKVPKTFGGQVLYGFRAVTTDQ